MKTVLVATHQISSSAPRSIFSCLGVLSLSAALKKNNLFCEVLDLIQYNSIDSNVYNEILDEITEKIINANGDIVGFSTMSSNLVLALDLSERVKKKKNKTLIVFGGPGTAFCAEEVLKNFKHVDIIFRGESEFIFPEFVHNRMKGNKNIVIPGMVIRTNGQIKDYGWAEPIKDLDTVPIPDYPLNEGASFKYEIEPRYGLESYISIEVGRGCPFSCTFCATSAFFKRKYRVKSVDRVIEEASLITRRLGKVKIIFHHDVFTLKRKYVIDLCDSLIEKLPELDWMCLSRLSTLDRELLLKMREAGCRNVFIGIESTSGKMQEKFNKKIDLIKLDDILLLASQIGVTITIAFIFGFPEEEKKDVFEIIDYALKTKMLYRKNVKFHFSTLVPMLGTQLFETWRDNLLFDEYGSNSTNDIPFAWKKHRDTIKKYPDIFSVYHHLNYGVLTRMNSIRFEAFGTVLEDLAEYSIPLIYLWKRVKLTHFLINHIEKVSILEPEIEGSKKTILYAMIIKELISSFLDGDSEKKKIYGTIAEYEIAKFDIQHGKKDENYRIISANANPVDLINKYIKNDGIKDFPEHIDISDEESRYVMFWQKETESTRILKIEDRLSNLIKQE